MLAAAAWIIVVIAVYGITYLSDIVKELRSANQWLAMLANIEQAKETRRALMAGHEMPSRTP